MYRSAAGRSILPAEHSYIDYLNQVFQADGYRVPDLMRAIVLSRSFYLVVAPERGETRPSQRAQVLTRNGGHS